MLGLGAPELVVILLLVVLLFGATKIPALGRSVGEGLSNFKRGLREGGNDPPLPDAPPRDRAAVDDVHPPRS
jgi:TatA/E family protein of Tat protein translocase